MSAYGYLRVARDEPEECTRQVMTNLRRFAARRGQQLAEIYRESDPRSMGAFSDLVSALQIAGEGDVVLLSLEHLSAHRLIRNCMLEILETAAATIWVVRD